MLINTVLPEAAKPEQTKTATPSLLQQTIVPDSGKTLSGVTIEPITSTLLTSLDSDFKPENIAKDANLFGLVGTHEGRGETAYATGTAKPVRGVNTINGLAFEPIGFSVTHSNGAHWGTFYAVNGNITSLTSVGIISQPSVGDGYFSFNYSGTSLYDFRWYAIGVKN